MGGKKRTPALKPRVPEPTPAVGGPPWILIGGIVAVAAVATLAFIGSTGEPTPESISGSADSAAALDAAEADLPVRPTPPPAPEDRTPIPASDAQMPPLPLVPNMVPRSPDVIRDAYMFAAQRPDVLEYVPCFCGCETAGHKRNADCFVASRNPDGSVREWDTHGMACTICIDVARDSMQLHASGASTDDIRAAVDEKYAVYPRQTPTPAPPAN